MSGHSKWKTIKHKKALTDAKKSKHFSKVIREIEVCARAGGGDPAANATLRTLLEKARDINMPLENATRAIKKGTGELAGEAYEAYTYEGYAPHNIAVMIEVLTSNKNRTISELRHVFNYKSGILGTTVGWMFDRKGVITFENKKPHTEDELLELLIDYAVDDISVDDDMVSITMDPKALEQVKHALVSAEIPVKDAQLEWVAKDSVALNESQTNQVLDFLDALEDLDDVQNVFSNLG
ncbi:MAG: hypothetical protein UU47_C0015G0019 [candidate division TM6 bacterium GW2011_GWE2_41_16]|nr:MAG: hypothetical protein UU47_C0015G0019 [candidate division TM6 bacterium GW2011_GWE2_41_16]